MPSFTERGVSEYAHKSGTSVGNLPEHPHVFASFPSKLFPEKFQLRSNTSPSLVDGEVPLDVHSVRLHPEIASLAVGLLQPSMFRKFFSGYPSVLLLDVPDLPASIVGITLEPSREQ